MGSEQIISGADSAAEVDAASDQSTKIEMVYFTSASCQECLRVKQAMPGLIAEFQDFLSITRYDIDESGENLAKLLEYLDRYGLGNIAPPVIFINEKALIGEKEITNNLQEVLFEEMTKFFSEEPANFQEKKVPQADAAQNSDKQPLQSDQVADTTDVSAENPNDLSDVKQPVDTTGKVTPQQAQPEEAIEQQFRKLNVGAVAAAGLLDGINPCAFTTIVFFVSMLAYLGKSKRQILIVGIGFTVAVFLTYLLLGLGLLGAAKSFFVTQGITAWVTRIVAVLMFVLAGWSLLDLIKYTKTHNTQSMTLGLPKSIKAKIHKVIRVGMGTGGLLTGALSVGVLVSLLESVCTGQIYLPIIIYVAKSSVLRIDAIGYLLLYNLMFILPLVIIFMFTYFGVRSETLGSFLGRHIMLAKFVMVVLFFGLGLLLLLT